MMKTHHRLCTDTSVVALPATTVVLGPLLVIKAPAYGVTDQLKINLLVACAFQCREPSGAGGAGNAYHRTAPIQPERISNLTKQRQVLVTLGFAAGNDLHQVSTFVLAPWAADLQDGVKTINGRDRSYLLGPSTHTPSRSARTAACRSPGHRRPDVLCQRERLRR